MKKIFLICFVCCSIMILASCCSMKVLNGDGNIVTEEISITDYNKIEIAGGSIDFNYEQSDASPYLKVTVDKNIYEMMEMKVINDKLVIRPKSEFKRYNIRPTQFTITSNSLGLTEVDAAGNIHFNLNSPLSSPSLKIDVAGSGTINLNQKVEVDKMKIELAGSGKLNSIGIQAATFEGEISGSGTLNLNGKIEMMNLEIAGSGTIKAFGCEIADLKCEIAGSGNIEANVLHSIRAEIAGSGNIRYKGDPTISKSVAGSGSIKKVE